MRIKVELNDEELEEIMILLKNIQDTLERVEQLLDKKEEKPA